MHDQSALLVEWSSIGWILLCTFLVLFMQLGFLLLETGLVRAKSSVNVAYKNLADFCVSSLSYWILGFGVMFGGIGEQGLFFNQDHHDSWTTVFFFFQLAFCGTAVTIISGAMAERVSFRGYLLSALICSTLIYPVYGHWAWGGLAFEESRGWLENMGFIDFAGSTVVHGIGGWVALAAVLVIGPRLGRFGRKTNDIRPHSLPMVISGVFVLWIGWFGFNGGSVLALDDSVPGILLNTLIAATAGGVASTSICWFYRRKPRANDIVMGVLAGLVAVTANCHMVNALQALVIGAVGSLVCYAANSTMNKLKIDDAVAAVPVHLAAGIWGTLAVAIFGDTSMFAEGVSRLQQLQIQLLGVVSAGAYAFTVAYGLLWLCHRAGWMRVSKRAEVVGLNISEHNETSSVQSLLRQIEHHARTGDFSRPIQVERSSESGLFAASYNRVLKRVQNEYREKQFALDELAVSRDAANSANVAKSQFLANISHELRTPLNAILGFAQILSFKDEDEPLSEEDRSQIRQIEKSGSELLALIDEVLEFTTVEANGYDLNEENLDPEEILQSARDTYLSRLRQAGLSAALEIQADLPNLYADRKAVRQMLLNVLSNTVKHAKKSGEVTLRCFLTSDRWMNIEIEDQGVGISAAQLTSIVEPFRQEVPENIMHKPDGIGLGLPIVQALLKLHQGELIIRSQPGDRTAVTLRFPPSRAVHSASAH